MKNCWNRRRAIRAREEHFPRTHNDGTAPRREIDLDVATGTIEQTFMPIDQRKSDDIPAANDVMKGTIALGVSKIVTKVSRHPLGWYLYHVGWSRTKYSILQAGLIAGRKDTNEGRQTVFFTALDVTALDPKSNEPDKEGQDLSGPRKVRNKSKWKVTHGAISWIN